MPMTAEPLTDEWRLPGGAARVPVAKTDPADPALWLPLTVHLADTACVIGDLVDHRLPPRFAEGFGLDRAAFRRLAVAAALLHDLGKATPLFQAKITERRPELRERLRAAGLDPADMGAHLKENIPHSFAGAEMLRLAGADEGLSAVVGAHHGRTEPNETSMLCERSPKSFGWTGKGGRDTPWGDVQREVICWAAARLGVASLADLPPCPLSAQLVLSGLTVMADWIASNMRFFPLIPAEELPDRYAPGRADAALSALCLPGPWQVSADWRSAGFFPGRFGFAENAVQAEAMRIAEGMDTPGVMIVEAPMGQGKTEAALAAAEILMERFGLGGAAFFLPSQATSDAMFARLTAWAEHQPDADGIAVELAHGQADLNDEFRQLAEGSVHVEQGEQDAGALTVHSFFRGRKTRLLADLVVGTVDQLLMAALKQRHVMLRHLGLAGKAVIVDECHAYDAYMDRYLDSALSYLGTYRVPVILLSATLPKARREELLRAYARNKKLPFPPDVPDGTYPLISWTQDQTICAAAVPSAGGSRTVDICRVDEEQALAAAAAALTHGCVGIVVNTVRRAQALHDLLRTRCPQAQILLDHSRFLAPDRAAHEKEILAHVGKRSTPDDRAGVLVIGTQVLEQSLDLDFDLLITDLCPMDLLLQRIGRLHRHGRPRPAGLQTPRCLILGAQGEPDKGSVAVYGEYLLLRTRALLPDKICLPEDISPLVQAAYDTAAQPPDEHTAAAQEAYREGQKQLWQKAGGYCLEKSSRDVFDTSIKGLLDTDFAFDEQTAQAAVRDGTACIEVLVVRRAADGMAELLSGPARGSRYRADSQPSMQESRSIAAQRLRLPAHFGAHYCVDEVIGQLEDASEKYLPTWRQSPMLAGELFLLLDENGEADLAGHRIAYDPALGLTEKEETHGNDRV